MEEEDTEMMNSEEETYEKDMKSVDSHERYQQYQRIMNQQRRRSDISVLFYEFHD